MRPSTALFSRQVERLVTAVHRTVVARHGSQLRPLIERLQLRSPGHLVDLAEFLAAGTWTMDVVRLRFPYREDGVVEMFHDLLTAGLIDGDRQPAGQLAHLVRVVLAARSETAETLWAGNLDAAQEGADEALQHAAGSLVELFRAVPEPSEPAHRLHHVLNGVRYGRLDAHVSAWQAQKLQATEIVALSAANESGHRVAVPAGLLDRGWIEAGGSITNDGRTARAAIEADTNARCDAMFDGVAHPQLWYDALRALHDDGP